MAAPTRKIKIMECIKIAELDRLLDEDGILKEQFEGTYWYVRMYKCRYFALICLTSIDDLPNWVEPQDELVGPMSEDGATLLRRDVDKRVDLGRIFERAE